MGVGTRLALAATYAVTCTAVVLGFGYGSGGVSPASATTVAEAKRVTARFLTALDRGRYEQACTMLARQFYRRNHVVDREHCIVGFKVGMGGTAVKFRITGVRAHGDRVSVHAIVDGAPGTVELVREGSRFRVLACRGD